MREFGNAAVVKLDAPRVRNPGLDNINRCDFVRHPDLRATAVEIKRDFRIDIPAEIEFAYTTRRENIALFIKTCPLFNFDVSQRVASLSLDSVNPEEF